MDVEKLREFRRADPFRPFKLVMKDGRKLLVEKSYYLGIAPDKKMLVHSSEDGGFEIIAPASVAAIEGGITVTEQTRRRPNRRKGAA